MSDRCQSCHWWGASEPPFDTGWGECTLIGEDPSLEGQKRQLSKLATATGREPGEGYLMTRGTFGCVEWAPIAHPAAWVGEGSTP